MAMKILSVYPVDLKWSDFSAGHSTLGLCVVFGKYDKEIRLQPLLFQCVKILELDWFEKIGKGDRQWPKLGTN